MKIEGVLLGKPSEKLICFPRTHPETGEEYEIPFTCRAVLDYKEFEELCPEPEPPNILRKGEKVQVPDFDDPGYKKAIFTHGTRKIEFIVLKSLEATEGLTWDEVKMSEPATWELWRTELETAGFTEYEIGRLHLEVMRVNAVNDDTLVEARESFLRKRAALLEEKEST